MNDTFLLAIIIGCEAGFWVVLLLGLVSRYVFKLNTMSMVLLVSIPLIDVVLLIATILDLNRGAVATFAHGLAAAYIGFSIAFGGVTIRWMDGWFAHKFAGAPTPPSAPTHGWKLFRHELIFWLRCVLAVAVMQTLVFAAIYFISDPARTKALEAWFVLPLITVALWFLFGPLWVLVFNRSVSQEEDA